MPSMNSAACAVWKSGVRPRRWSTSALAMAVVASSLAGAAPVRAATNSARSGGHQAGTTRSAQRAPGYLGIEFHDLTDEQAAALHLRKPHGVEVLMVDHDGPAGHVGIEPHDIITGMNGHIVSSGESLRAMIHDAGAGTPVALAIFRDGHTIVIHTRLANRADVARRALARITAGTDAPPAGGAMIVSGFAESYTVQPAPAAPQHSEGFLASMLHGAPFTGLNVEMMQPQLASFFGAPRGVGLLVQSVAENSPAAESGLHAGDVILSANGKTLTSDAEWNHLLRGSKDKPMQLAVLRDRHEMMLSLVPDAKRH
jgi:S1-C subfamily serine protease